MIYDDIILIISYELYQLFYYIFITLYHSVIKNASFDNKLLVVNE